MKGHPGPDSSGSQWLFRRVMMKGHPGPDLSTHEWKTSPKRVDSNSRTPKVSLISEPQTHQSHHVPITRQKGRANRVSYEAIRSPGRIPPSGKQ